MTVLLEVCIDSFASAAAAKAGGADRLEVCSSLALGGLTPSFGLVEQCVASLNMPVMMMIRPHDGGFVYGNDDVNTMLRDIKVARTIGVQGVVFGALTPRGTVDRHTCQRVIDAAGPLEMTFHRAFDLVSDPLAMLEQLEMLGIHRILTSGQQPTAIAGAELIGKLHRHANDLRILAGSGINEENAHRLVDLTGVEEIHASASVRASDEQTHHGLSFGAQHRVTCVNQVRAIKTSLIKTR